MELQRPLVSLLTAGIGVALACGTAPQPGPAAGAPPPREVSATTDHMPETPPTPQTPQPLTAPLHTEAGKLVDAAGHEVRITGVNWFGLETGTFAPHGLWARGLGEMLDQIVGLGFNTIRLPFSNQLFEPASKPNGIDFQKNPELVGRTGLEIMDIVIDQAGQRGLKVILDRHRPTSEAQAPLWYTDHVSEQRWIDDWTMLAARYRGNSTVIGADLHNEPHGPATWGDGNPGTDWRLAAERAGNAILQVNPDWLIIVEGIEHTGDDWYWWGGNLAAARQAPVRLASPDKLVYSPHDYGPGVTQQRWFQAFDFPYNLPRLWDGHWAYLQAQGIAPVLVGEFGGRSVGQDVEGVWQRTLVAYLDQHGISYTYWSWNPNSGDTGGILLDDWTSVDSAKLNILSAYQWPLLGQPVPHAQTSQPAGGPAPGSQAPVPAAVTPADTIAMGGPFDPDPHHTQLGLGGPNDPDAAHRQARERDERRYLEQFGQPWEHAVYVTR